MSKQEAQQIHRRTILFQHDMKSNVGEQQAWTDVGGDWTGSDYVSLGQGDSLTSIKLFRYGVAMFVAWADDWTDIIAGFQISANDYIQYEDDDFHSEIQNTGEVSSDVALTDSTYYKFKIIWCPQFCRIEVYTLAGVLTGKAEHWNPSVTPMPLYFECKAATGATLRILGVTVQEGDDANFFLRKTDFVTMQMEPHDGATWQDLGPPWTILLNANAESISFHGVIKSGYSRFRIHLTYTGGGNDCTSRIDWQDACAGISDNGVTGVFPSPLPACNAFDDYNTQSTSWISINGLITAVVGELVWVTNGGGGAFYILAVAMELER